MIPPTVGEKTVLRTWQSWIFAQRLTFVLASEDAGASLGRLDSAAQPALNDLKRAVLTHFAIIL